MKKVLHRGFTLIELLIVIGILAILVVAVLLTINPAEAQRKARDAKRMKDLGTLQTVIEQYLDGGGAPVCVASTCSTTGASPSQICNGGWIAGANLCNYIPTLPIDPSNNATRNCAGCAAAAVMVYELRMDAGGGYELRVRQESTQNLKNVANDGGEDADWAESGSDTSLDLL